ncbi:MAG: hypothetical protein ACXWZU_08350 [Actinomycetota bacterium]
MASHVPIEGRDEPRTARLVRHPAFRALFMGLAMVAAALGAPLKVEPPPPGRVPVEVVRGEGDDEDGPELSPDPSEPVR